MKRLHILALTCVCLGIAAALLFRANTHVTAASPSNCGAWNVVPSANNSNDDVFTGIAAIAANDIWAVGYSFTNKYDRTLIEHWDGTSWSIIPSANVPAANNDLSGVTAVSATDVWAVGSVQKYGMSLIEHWDGTTWSLVTGPSFTGSLYLSAVAAAFATDIWAVGEVYENHHNGTLLEHWNGTAWSIDNDFGALFSNLYGVTVVSSTDVWVVGSFGVSDTALIGHWNGTTWSRVKGSGHYNTLYGIAAVSASDIWAVGYSAVGNSIIEHWNGSTWSHVSGGPGIYGVLSAIAVVSATDVWAVGLDTTTNTPYGSIGITLTEHWDGTTWSVVPSPNPGNYGNRFNAVASIPGSNYVWAVGEEDSTINQSQYISGTLTAYYC
jgi:hypothetical protein